MSLVGHIYICIYKNRIDCLIVELKKSYITPIFEKYSNHARQSYNSLTKCDIPFKFKFYDAAITANIQMECINDFYIMIRINISGQ